MAGNRISSPSSEPETAGHPEGRPPLILAAFTAAGEVTAAGPVLRLLAQALSADVVLAQLDLEGHDDAPDLLDPLTTQLRHAGVQVDGVRFLGHNLVGSVQELAAQQTPDLILTVLPGPNDPLRDRVRVRDLIPSVSCLTAVLAGPSALSVPTRIAYAPVQPRPGVAGELVESLERRAPGVRWIVSAPPSPGQAALNEVVAQLRESGEEREIVGVEASRRRSAILQEADPGSVDLLVLDAPRDGPVQRLGLGTEVEQIARRSAVPLLIVKAPPAVSTRAFHTLLAPIDRMLPKLSEAEKADTYRAVRRGSRGSTDFFFMLSAAALIATLGLLLDSPAVVIGGMLVAPLMMPVTGLGLAIVHGDPRLLATSVDGVLRGSLLVLGVSLVVAELIPGAAVTAEADARGEPTLLDLGVAVAGGAAGAFAVSRASVAAALPGVAIAVALVPPLAATGIGVAQADWGLAGGAALLFVANLVAIAGASGLVFFWLGFRPEPGRALRVRVFNRGFTALLLLAVGIGVPLGILTKDSLDQSSLQHRMEEALTLELAQRPQLTWVDADVHDDAGVVEATVTLESSGPLSLADVELLQAGLARRLDREVRIVVRVFQVTELAPGAR